MSEEDFESYAESDSPRELAEMIVAALHPAPEQAEPAWQPIESAPIGTSMFFVRGFNVDVSDRIRNYTTDPYGVWQPTLGKFERWPHPFAPTHWLPLPTPPEAA